MMFSDKPYIMGVLNVTPDSFSDGGDFYDLEAAATHGLNLIRNGSDIIDIGGESSRPGAIPVEPQEEIRRIVPVIERLRNDARFISADTRNALTMKASIEAGANIINDISALTHDPESINLLSHYDTHIILMHMKGTPQTMQNNPVYLNVVDEVRQFFDERIKTCETHGIQRERLILDPGIGFGKTLEHNLLLLRNIKVFFEFGCPVMLGVSRKSFIGDITGAVNPGERLPGSLAAALWGLSMGINIFRVHDVQETRQALDVYTVISEAGL